MSSQTQTSTHSRIAPEDDPSAPSEMTLEEYRVRLGLPSRVAALDHRRRLVATRLKESHSSSPAYAHYTWDDWLRLAGGALNTVKPYLKP